MSYTEMNHARTARPISPDGCVRWKRLWIIFQ